MRLSANTIRILAQIITGNSRSVMITRNVDDVKDFFEDIKYQHPSIEITIDTLGGFEDSDQINSHTLGMLKQYNGTEAMKDIIYNSLDQYWFSEKAKYAGYDNIEAVSIVENCLLTDGYSMTYADGGTHLGGYRVSNISPLDKKLVEVTSVRNLNDPNVTEHIEKAEEKLNSEDYSGAITNARTLVEEILGKIINDEEKINKCGGDVKRLYTEAKKAMGIDQSNNDLTTGEQQILSGLNSIVNGIGTVSNDMGDRHAGDNEPLRRHAKLAVNASFTFCEFTVDHFQNLPERKNNNPE